MTYILFLTIGHYRVQNCYLFRYTQPCRLTPTRLFLYSALTPERRWSDDKFRW